jgi:hypothetical protein
LLDEVVVSVNVVEELAMKLLFCSISVVLLLSVTVFADQEFVGETENALEAETTTGTTRCTMDLNQWGHSSNCQCGADEYYNQKTGQCLDRRTTSFDHKPKPESRPETMPVKPRFTRCTKDLNRWGHSSRCGCSLPNFEYDQRVGRCLPSVDEDAVAEAIDGDLEDESHEQEHEGGIGSISGCEGGSISADGLAISCPDGSTYHRSRNTVEELSRHLAETVEERGPQYDIDTEESFPQPFAGRR